MYKYRALVAIALIAASTLSSNAEADPPTAETLRLAAAASAVYGFQHTFTPIISPSNRTSVRSSLQGEQDNRASTEEDLWADILDVVDVCEVQIVDATAEYLHVTFDATVLETASAGLQTDCSGYNYSQVGVSIVDSGLQVSLPHGISRTSVARVDASQNVPLFAAPSDYHAVGSQITWRFSAEIRFPDRPPKEAHGCVKATYPDFPEAFPC